MQVIETGSVRVDLVGGTLDLEPINLILPNVVTLNVATSLKAQVELEASDRSSIVINSLDYNKTYEFHSDEMTDHNLYDSDYFKEMSFVLQILDLFNIRKNVKVNLKSGAPAGSGLGGSSAMGVTLYKALCKFTDSSLDPLNAVMKVKSIEGRILNRGIPGYQDYFPAVLGGVLALRGVPGKIEHEQLFSMELKAFLEKHITLVYSGISRNSGINNWDVYKSFFDGDELIRSSLREIAKVSYETYLAIKEKRFENILSLIAEEGNLRKGLAPNIVPSEVQSFSDMLIKDNIVNGMKMCGAGGGGCFIFVHPEAQEKKLEEIIKGSSYQKLEFQIDWPIQ